MGTFYLGRRVLTGEEIHEFRENKLTFEAIGSQFGLTRQAVNKLYRKWLREQSKEDYPTVRGLTPVSSARSVKRAPTKGYVYVIESSNEIIKVGQSADANKRLATHRYELTRWGLSSHKEWSSDLVADMSCIEKLVIAYMRENSFEKISPESFKGGVTFEQVVSYAGRLVSEYNRQLSVDTLQPLINFLDFETWVDKRR